MMPDTRTDDHPVAAFAERVYRSAGKRHLLFLLATVPAILLIGYHFGIFDHAVHIPYLRHNVDPTLYPNDRFLSLRAQHFSFFWYYFEAFYRLGMLEVTLFVSHVLATYLTFWAIWLLADELFHDPLTCVLAVLAFIFPHVGFAGFTVFEWSFLNRTFVLPFLLYAIVLFLRRRYWPACALLGLLFNLHVISVAYVMVLFLFDALFEWRRIGWRNLVMGLILFVACALPVLIWKATSSGIDLSLRPELLSVIERGMAFNLYHLFARDPLILIPTLGGFSGLALFFVGRGKPAGAHDRTLTYFVYAIFAVLGALVVTTEWLPVTVVLQFQVIRIGVFGLIFGYLYFANYVVRLIRQGDSRLLAGALGSTLALASSPILPLIAWGSQHLGRTRRWRLVIPLILIPVLLGANLYAAIRAWQTNWWSPGVHIFARQTPWYDVQIWARDNTPKDALFITPPHIWGQYESEWRVFSERSTVVTRTELMEAGFAPNYLDYWLPRFNALAPGAVDRFRGNNPENVAVTSEAFYGLTTADLLRVARQYGATHLVTEKPHLHDLPMVYQNERFVIYDLSAKEGE